MIKTTTQLPHYHGEGEKAVMEHVPVSYTHLTLPTKA